MKIGADHQAQQTTTLKQKKVERNYHLVCLSVDDNDDYDLLL